MAQPTESEEHKAWSERQLAASAWRAWWSQGFLHFFAAGNEKQDAMERATDYANTMAQVQEGWFAKDAKDDDPEPPYLTPADRIEGELPGHVPGNPGDPFARRPAYNPHT